MPRHPRPAKRKLSGKELTKPDSEGESDPEEGDSWPDKFEEGSSQRFITRIHGLEGGDAGEDDDADAPRIAQWADDNEEFQDDDSESEGSESEISAEEMLKSNLEKFPLGALRQAQHLAEAESGSDSEKDSNIDSEAEPEVHDIKGKKKERVEWSAKPRTDISKRSNKHAPTEVTSKRPVTRKRTVVEIPKLVPRDPRFLPTAGEFSADRFQKSYGFLADNHKKELNTLRETLKQARKLLASSPRDLWNEREREVYRLEQAVKRAESMVNRDRLQQVEREALSKVKKEEQQKRIKGKGEWWMKKGEKQQVVVQARYEALAKEGGQRAVKKAIEKKQKKESQKEKRSRPYEKGEYPPAKRRRQ